MLDTYRGNETTYQDAFNASTTQPLHELGIATGTPTCFRQNNVATL